MFLGCVRRPWTLGFSFFLFVFLLYKWLFFSIFLLDLIVLNLFWRNKWNAIHHSPHKWDHGGQCSNTLKLFTISICFSIIDSFFHWGLIGFKSGPSLWITCCLTWLSKLSKSKSAIQLRSLTTTRCCQRGRPRWTSPFARWYPCLSCILPSR